MSKRMFDREFMFEEVLWGDKVIEDKIEHTSRWSEYHRLVFKYEDKFWITSYSQGLTEMQDESPWQDEEEVECWEAKPVEKTIVTYEAIK